MSPAWNKLLSCYRQLLALCDMLETIADNLPKPPPPAQCRTLGGELAQALDRTHREEEQVLLPLLAQSGRPELRQLAIRLRREHDADSLAALEIGEALLAMSGDDPIPSAEAKGYMLRSFFESTRRHVHTEQDLIALLGPRENPFGTDN
ncbi:hemerythrin domain-containing protein [Devosia sp. YIM 151766]|uniref:hemerythrin domain-containing protein n=1 Tax=Devosia sp. YIM 151766 TaxID=3017325 RepID=UPI00255CDCFF|nr:hemerythrin domain-containing protein [Devosia sp. YIM 151766]WIY52376.1 hemerythrin domain-containing protein [Devosia sp. YIM 151766]